MLFLAVMEYHISAGNAWDGSCMKENAYATVKVVSFCVEISEAFVLFSCCSLSIGD